MVGTCIPSRNDDEKLQGRWNALQLFCLIGNALSRESVKVSCPLCSAVRKKIAILTKLCILHKKTGKSLQKNGYRNTIIWKNSIQISQRRFCGAQWLCAVLYKAFKGS